VRTGITLLVLLGLLLLGGAYGLHALFAPLPSTKTTATTDCRTTSVKKGQRIRAGQVQVSVFNGGTRPGLADETLGALGQRGFQMGEAGNAPSGAKVKVAKVWTTQRHDAAAELVARQFGPSIKVFHVKADLGAGVDVLVGDDFRHLVKAKRGLVVGKPSSACLPSPSPSPAGG
jgi:hypothetical protein